MIGNLLKHKIVPVITIDDIDNAEPLAESLLEGGISVIEITLRTRTGLDAISRISKSFPEMLLGAGTVLTKKQARQAIEAGANFGLAPGLNKKVIRRFQSLGGLFIPGVMTPSEIESGLDHECKLLKFFPAGKMGGVSMLETISEPYSSHGVKFCTTGGITLNNMNEYLSSPMVAMVGGSWIATRQQIVDQQWSIITQQAKMALQKSLQ